MAELKFKDHSAMRCHICKEFHCLAGCIPVSLCIENAAKRLSYPEVVGKVRELGGVRFNYKFNEAVFKHDDRPIAEKFAEWIKSRGAWNIQFNQYDVSEPGLSVLFDYEF